MSRWGRLVPGAAFVFYLLIALEAVIMITPFTVYFYALYAPVLTRLEGNPWTAWLTAFFLPHITYTGDTILTALAWLGPVLLTLGLGTFLVCAGQVYSAKLLRRGVVSGGLYRRIRHPQYLGLGLAGLGLLLYWPRFIILLLYLSMLFVYYLLARHEEARMEVRFGEAYRRYRDATWMFLPGEPGGRLFSWLFGWTGRRGWALTAAYVTVLVLGTGVAFALRAYSLSRTSMVRYSDTLSVVSLAPAGGAAIERTLATAIASPEVAALLAKFHRQPDHTLVAYIVPKAYMMQHLIADLGEHEAHHGQERQTGFGATVRHLGEMYALAPLRQLRDGASSPEKRIIFTEALTAAGSSVPVSRALDAGVLRFPLFFAELDGEGVILAMETPRRHSWGTIPVPAF
jgi:protein-S-isoprenylcysteine O-methyltransferase Ste14